ncbi:MAG: alpha/beta fold hydrolase [Anaerolineae bacterium]|nr:alpha/beta fold hydrolase [Anaerolineae bacterium]
MTQRKSSLFGAALRGVITAAGAWIAYSRFAIDHAVDLPPAIDAERVRFRHPAAGFLSYYADAAQPGRPLVLIHSINAAASAYEMRPIFERFRGKRPIYALDLPGFGFSERADQVYTPDLYAGAVEALLERVASPENPADVVALSLGSEFAARAALRQPERVRSLTLISPSGLGLRQRTTGQYGDRALAAFRFPLWSQAFFDLLATRTSIRWFLQQSFVGDPDSGLVDYCVQTAHQPRARFAPLYFVSGKLFTEGAVGALYRRLEMPVMVLYDKDFFVRFDALPGLLRERPNWRAERIAPSLGLPQFERMDEVAGALERFWG